MKRGDKRVLFLTEQNITKVPDLTEVYSLIHKNNKFGFSFIILRLRFPSKGTIKKQMKLVCYKES